MQKISLQDSRRKKQKRQTRGYIQPLLTAGNTDIDIQLFHIQIIGQERANSINNQRNIMFPANSRNFL